MDTSTAEDRLHWSRMPNEESYKKLCAELMPFLPFIDSISCQHLLDFFFFTFHTGMTINTLSKHFYVKGKLIHSSTLHRHWDAVIEGLARWGRSKIKFLSIDDWKKDCFPIFEKEHFSEYRKSFFFFVDGTVVKTLDSSDIESSRALYNSKHKVIQSFISLIFSDVLNAQVPAFIFFVCVTPCGRIIYLSEETVQGKMPDKTHYEKEKVTEKLEKEYGNVEVEEGWSFCIGGDKGYPYISVPSGWKLYITKSGENTKDVDENGEEVEGTEKRKMPHLILDPGIARLRGVVERVIGRIKKWGIFQSKYHCYDVERVGCLVAISSGIVNWCFENNLVKKI